MFISASNLINSHTTSGPCLHYRNNFNWTFIKINALSGYPHSIWLHWAGFISWMCLLYTTSSPTALADDQSWWLDWGGFCPAELGATALSVSWTWAHIHALHRALPPLLHTTGFIWEPHPQPHQPDKRQRSAINNPPCQAARAGFGGFAFIFCWFGFFGDFFFGCFYFFFVCVLFFMQSQLQR